MLKEPTEFLLCSKPNDSDLRTLWRAARLQTFIDVLDELSHKDSFQVAKISIVGRPPTQEESPTT